MGAAPNGGTATRPATSPTPCSTPPSSPGPTWTRPHGTRLPKPGSACLRYLHRYKANVWIGRVLAVPATDTVRSVVMSAWSALNEFGAYRVTEIPRRAGPGTRWPPPDEP